jgi:polar amino acid transport system substrate-binding protein
MKSWVFSFTLFFLAGCVTPDHPGSSVVRELAPSGKLRAAINYGNGVLAQKGPNGEARGVSVDLARELARRLDVPLELVSYDAAGKVTAAATSGAWDVAFVARDPARAEDIEFTAPYVIIEGGYMVPAASPLQSADDVDREGVRVAVGRGSAYDLYLSRALKRATLVRAAVPGPAASIELFERVRPEAFAGVKPAVVDYARAHPEVRVLPGRFMLIEQCMATPRGRSGGARYLAGFVDEMKASGFVAASLERSGQKDAAVAP